MQALFFDLLSFFPVCFFYNLLLLSTSYDSTPPILPTAAVSGIVDCISRLARSPY